MSSSLTATIGGLAADGAAAAADLRIDNIQFSQRFGGFAAMGGVVTLTFDIETLGPNVVSGISFTDDLEPTLTGLVAIGLSALHVCGTDSRVNGTSVIEARDGTLMPGGSCSIAVDLAVPLSAAEGNYTNVTGPLYAGMAMAATPAMATITVVTPVNSVPRRTHSGR